MEMEKIAEREWWQDGAGFFGRHYMSCDDSLEGYRAQQQTLEERTKIEVDGIIKLLGLEKGSAVLDCPCGYGRHSLGLAEQGIEVVGVDINSEELQVCLGKRADYLNARFVQQDMRKLIYKDQFDAVINMFYSFGFFEEDEENLKVIRNFYNALKPGGKFLMHTDVNVERIMAGDYVFSEYRTLTNGNQVKQEEWYDAERERVVGTWHMVDTEGNVHEAPTYSMRVFTDQEFANWCYTIGFTKIETYAYWNGSPLTSDSEDMIIIATK